MRWAGCGTGRELNNPVHPGESRDPVLWMIGCWSAAQTHVLKRRLKRDRTHEWVKLNPYGKILAIAHPDPTGSAPPTLAVSDSFASVSFS